VESVSESALLSLFCGEGFDWFEVEIVIQVEVVEILSMNQEIEHVVTLTTDLKSCFYPIEFSHLEELCVGESFEEWTLVLGLGRSMMQLIQNPTF
jgi:hypothetical protein